MTQTRLYIDARLGPGTRLSVGGDKARYLGKVLRLRIGDGIFVFNGNDGEYRATLVKLSKNEVTIELGGPVESDTESTLRVHLVQGISRGERMDFVVQKAAELGVKRITPVLTEYGVVKLAAERAAKRREHWQKVAISACEQAGRIRPPLVEGPITLKDWFGQRTSAADIDLILRPGAERTLASIRSPKTKICMLVGPEGGFSPTEYDDAAVTGFEPVSLGPRILRTETAAIASYSQANRFIPILVG